MKKKSERYLKFNFQDFILSRLKREIAYLYILRQFKKGVDDI